MTSLNWNYHVLSRFWCRCHYPGLLFINTLRPRQDGRHFPEDIFKRIFLNENVSISIKISLKFVPKGLINNIPALVQIMAWRRSGDKPLSEAMMVSLLTHICVARPQWVKWSYVLPQDLVKSRSHEIGCHNDCIALKFDRQLSSSAHQISERLEKSKPEPRSFETSCGKISIRLVNRDPGRKTWTLPTHI